MGRRLVPSALLMAATLGLSACTAPYNPSQRALDGGLMGAGAGAASDGLAGDDRGTTTGPLTGGAAGAIGGTVTTLAPPPPPASQSYPPGYYNPGYPPPSGYRPGY